jgi:hypothetical protein
MAIPVTPGSCPNCWANPDDPATISAIVLGCADPDYVVPVPADPDVALAIEIASDLLTQMSAFQTHPAGTAIEDFRASPRTHRLSPNYYPLREVVSVVQLTDCDEVPVDIGTWCIVGHSVYFSSDQCDYATWWSSYYGYGYGGYDYGIPARPGRGETLRMTYNFGSTVTEAAKRAMLTLARQLWLSCNPEAGECILPERVMSVNREGLSYTMLDPMTFLERAHTGIPGVDMWLSSINPSSGRWAAKAKRRSGVWTPDAPPPVNRSYVTATPPVVTP